MPPAKPSVYAVGIAAQGQGKSVAITKQQYEDVLAAKTGLMHCTNIEESYDIVVKNFELFYEEALRIALHFNLYANLDRPKFMYYRREFNRLMGNLLTSCCSLEEITNKKLSNALGRKCAEQIQHRDKREKMKKSSLSFRLMEAIRDLQQHAGLVVTGASPHVKRTTMTLDSSIEFSAVVNFNKQELTQDSRFSKKLAADIPSLPDKIDGIPHIASYMEEISAIHAGVRKSLVKHVKVWENSLETVYRIVEEAYPKKDWTGFVPVAVFEFPDSQMIGPIASEYIGRELFQYRKDLETKNHELKNLSRSYVTGQKL